MMREGQAARAPIRRLRTAVVLLLTTIVVGVVGYLVLGAPTVADAVYMVAITLFTVGFGEVFPLTETGRWFTVGLIVVGFGSATFSAVSAMEVIADGHVKALLRRNQMDRRIAQLRGHVIVCGYGRVGRHLVGELAAAGHGFVVVEAGEARVGELREAEHLYVDADATEELTLHEAGIERADALVACVADDGDNVLIVLTAKGLNPDVQTVARVKADENEPKLRRAGADHVLVPTAIGGRRIAEMLTRPAVGAEPRIVSTLRLPQRRRGREIVAVLDPVRARPGTEALDHADQRVVEAAAERLTAYLQPGELVAATDDGRLRLRLRREDRDARPERLQAMAYHALEVLESLDHRADDGPAVLDLGVGWAPVTRSQDAHQALAHAASAAAESVRQRDLQPRQEGHHLRVRRPRIDRWSTGNQVLVATVGAVVVPYLALVALSLVGVDLSGVLYWAIVGSLATTAAMIWAETSHALDPPRPSGRAGERPRATAVIAAYLPNEADTILETVEPNRATRRERLRELLGELGLAEKANRRGDALSGGERRRVEITRALVLDPKFMLLDEPFAGIDPIAVHDIQGMIEQLKKKGIGVIITDHNVRETLSICDRAYILKGGTIIKQGTPEEIAADAQVREIYLGDKFSLA